MALERYQRPYVESSVFISWIKGEVTDGVARGAIAKHVLELAERKAYKVYTSALTLAEVHKVRAGPTLTSGEDDRFLAYCEHEWIEIIDVSREVGEQANRLCRQYGIKKPNDAIHLACALAAGCDVLLTWDHADLLGLTVPHIRIEPPRIIGQASMFTS